MSFNFKCPYCQNLFTAEDEWVGQTTQCPNCRNQIVIQKPQPQLQSISPTGNTSRGNLDASGEKKKKSGCWRWGCGCGAVILILLVIILAVAGFGRGPSVKRVEKQLKTEIFPELFRDKSAFYCGAEVINVTLKRDDKNKYSGEIEFRRNGKICKRSVAASYDFKDDHVIGMITKIDYIANPAFLEEDADIFYRSIQETVTDLKEWRFVSAKTIAAQTVRCTVTKDRKTKTLDVKCELTTKGSNCEYNWEIVRADKF